MICAAVAAPSAMASSGALPSEILPYSPDSGFRRPIAARPRIDPRSRAIVARLRHNLSQNKALITTEFDVPPVYVVRPSDPMLTVNVGGRDVRFRVPRRANAGSGQDRPLELLDPSSPTLGRDVELRLYRASIDRSSGRVNASGAGLFRYGPTGSGAPFLGHGTGSGLSLLNGLVRGRDVASGTIRHAIRFAYSSADFLPHAFRSPALSSDQPQAGYTADPAGAMVMGMRLQLDPRVNCDARTVPGRADGSGQTRFLRILCHALQRYGMIVADGTEPGVMVLQMENVATAPWGGIIGSTNNGNYGFIIRDTTTPGDGLHRTSSSGIPWGRMRVIAG
ncbi:MAG: hypothetical protein U0Y82_09065 [Thermoleophilia bacterium]